MDAQKQPKRECICCEKDGPDLMKLFGPNQFICKACYAEQNHQLVEYKKNKPVLYPSIDLIIDHIYLGNEDAAMDQQTFEKYNITAVCVCGAFLMTPFQEKQGIKYIKYEIADLISQEIKQHFDGNYEWMEQMLKEGRNILIHCAAGVSRSASFTIAYLLKKNKMKYAEAFSFVKEKRNIIRPNSYFIQQLKEYQIDLTVEKY